MTARFRFVTLILVLSACSAVAPATAIAAAPVETTTTLTVSPTSGDSATDFVVKAKISPIPDSGQVRFSDWTAQSGGSVTWERTYEVNSTGVAMIPDGTELESGVHWWQAEYLGNPNFAPSTSTRKSISVTGLPTAIHDVSINWGANQITYTGRGDRSGGAIELFVDGKVHASCIQWSTTAPMCSASNNLAPGQHAAWLTFVPKDKRYGPSSSSTFTYWNGGALPPASGILIEGNRFSTRSLDVRIDAAQTTAGQAVAKVRLANSSAVDGSGLLTDGTTFDYASTLPWSLPAGADGHRTVWGQLIDANGRASSPYSDTIYYDTTPPTGTFVINNDDETLGDPWSGTIYEQRLTGSVSDASLDEGGEITHVAFSNDGRHFRVGTYDWEPSAFDDWWMVTHGWGAPNVIEAGTKTVYAKWRDAAGNWSPVATDTIFLITSEQAGVVLVDGELTAAPNPAYRSSTTVTLTIDCPYPPPEGLKNVRIGNQIEDSPTKSYSWPAGATSITVSWSLVDPNAGYTSGDGVKNIHVEFVTNSGGRRDFGAMVILDRAVPTSNTPVPGFALNTIVEGGLTASRLAVSATSPVAISTDIQWTGKDSTGIEQYNLDRLVNGTWTDVALNRPNAVFARETVSAGSTNQFRVKATDLAGNTGNWKTGPTFGATVIQENASSVVYSGTWRTESRADSLGGTLRYAKAAGAFARFTFTGRAIAWVAPRSAPGASADVYVDGVRIKTVFLSASTYQPRRIVFSMSWKQRGTHKIKIVKKSSSYSLRVDAFLVLT